MGLGITGSTRYCTASFLLASILIILLAEPFPICTAEQFLTLYSDDGRSLTISGRNSPDLGELGFDNTATSVQAHVTWILYENRNYHGAFQLISNTYKKLDHGLSGKVSSVRLVGSSDNGLDSSLTLYQGINFQGSEVYNFDDNPNVGAGASSLIKTGSEPWTIYSSSNFRGSSTCIDQDVLYDTTQTGIHSVRSVRRGCFN